MQDHNVRALELDVYVRDGKLLMCHGLAGCGKEFKSILEEINDFMERNPKEIITIFIESEGGWNPDKDSNKLYLEVYKSSGVFDKIFWPDYDNDTPRKARIYSVNADNISYQYWPTMQEMVNDNHRLVIFQDRHRGKGTIVKKVKEDGYYSINPFTWRYVRENSFSDQDHSNLLAEDCVERDQSKKNEINYPYRKVFRMNHAPLSSLTTIYSFTNEYVHLAERVQKCSELFKLVPNFIVIDYVQTGGGIEVVNLLNTEVWTKANPLRALKKLVVTTTNHDGVKK
jgi:hypothetical protein